MIGMTVCSGIGAPELSAPWIDWRYQSEIEPFPGAVLAHRFPNAVNLGDMTRFQEWPDATVDVLCGGTPCQSFSVAGLRKGLADPRGNLMLTYLAIADRFRSKWIVWENVPGVLSSNGGRDFGTFLGALGQLGYGFAYRVLDAQFCRTQSHPRAVPQRRRRVFVVGYLGDWRRAAAVLFDRESLSGNPPPRREAGQVAAPTLAARTHGGGGLGTDFDCDGGLIPEIVPQAMSSKCSKGSSGPAGDEVANLIPVAHSLRAGGFDASEDGTGRGTPLVPIAFSAKDYGGDAMEDCSPTLRAGGHSGSHANAGVMPAVAIQERAVSENPDNGPQGAGYRQDGAAYTLEARTVPQAVAFDLRGREGGAMPEGPHDTANIRAASGGSSRSYVAQPWAVRRLTPLEFERLQGFHDGWTDIPYRGKRAADGPRYKALGNSMAVNVMTLIFDRIRETEARP